MVCPPAASAIAGRGPRLTVTRRWHPRRGWAARDAQEEPGGTRWNRGHPSWKHSGTHNPGGAHYPEVPEIHLASQGHMTKVPLVPLVPLFHCSTVPPRFCRLRSQALDVGTHAPACRCTRPGLPTAARGCHLGPPRRCPPLAQRTQHGILRLPRSRRRRPLPPSYDEIRISSCKAPPSPHPPRPHPPHTSPRRSPAPAARPPSWRPHRQRWTRCRGNCCR